MSKRGVETPHIRGLSHETGDLHPWNTFVGAAHAVPGGAYRDRTDDLKLAKLALSQLS
jgi:hypothetical protein